MTRFYRLCLFFLLCFFAGSNFAQAKLPNVAVKIPEVKIAAHRAIYKMALSKAKNGSAVLDAGGTMLFDWADVCTGWAIQQQMKLHFNYAEGEESDVESSVVTWEAKDGAKYNFNVRRLTNGEEDEVFRGRAQKTEKTEKEGRALYAVPKGKEPVSLVKGSMFPTDHTRLIIEKALKGEKLFTRPVFDGSDEAGYAYVSAFIGPEIKNPQATEMNPDLKKSPLLDMPAWPVRLAFFAPDDETGSPDYEMDLVLQANGIARAMTIDYGDFSISGVLASIEPASDFSCDSDR